MFALWLALLTTPGQAQESDTDPTAEAWYHYTRGNHAQAARVAAALVEADPNDAAAHRAWVNAMMRVDYRNTEARVTMYRDWVADAPDLDGPRVGLVAALQASEDEGKCPEAITAIEALSDDPRNQYEGLRALLSLSCADVEPEDLYAQAHALSDEVEDFTLDGYSTWLKARDHLGKDLLPEIEALFAFPNARAGALAAVAFAEEADASSPTVVAVRALVADAAADWGAMDDPKAVLFARSLAGRMDEKKTVEALNERLDQLDPLPVDENGYVFTDNMRTIYDADRKPTHEAGLASLEKLARKVKKMAPHEQVFWHQRRMARMTALGMDEEAHQAGKEAAQLTPEDGNLVNQFAYAASLRGEDLELALELISTALDARELGAPRAGWGPTAWSESELRTWGAWEDTRGWLLYKLERHEEAVDALRLACALAPEAVMSAHMGLALVGAGDDAQAFVWLADAHRSADELDAEEGLRASSRAELERLWPHQAQVHPGGLDGWLVDTTPIEDADEAQDADDPLAGGSEHRLIGEPWPLKTGDLLAGGTLEVGPAEGGLLVVDMWATWCGPCVAGMPHLQEVADHYADRNVRVVGLSVDAQTAPVKKFFRGIEGLDYDLAHVGAGAMKDLDIPGIPALFIVGPDGTVLHYISGYGTGDTRLEQALDHFLEQGTVADAD